MKIKKGLISMLTLTLGVGIFYQPTQVEAVDFSKDETKYMTLCSSGQLSANNKSTCEAFNEYLKKKNKDLNQQLAEQKKSADQTANTLEDVQAELSKINNNISAKEAEIQYVETTITNTQAEIDQNSLEIKERMYAMQSYMNENTYINFIFGAEDFVDLLSRIDSYNELTQSDQELIEKMIAQKKEIESQKQTLESAKTALLAQKEQQASLQQQYTALLEEQKKNILATQNAIYDYGAATESLSAAIDKFNEEAKKEDTTPPSNSKPVPPANNTNNTNNDTNNNTTDNNQNTNSGTNTNTSGEVLGYNIYKIAYSKLGCLYYWGASGPSYFDCSGLVYYCLKNAGVDTYRTTAAEYSRKWTAVSWENSRTGDLVCFGNPAYHIGIVILNADGTRSVIHAGGGNSQTFGNDPNAKVKISSLEPGSYYYRNISTIRRVQ